MEGESLVRQVYSEVVTSKRPEEDQEGAGPIT